MTFPPSSSSLVLVAVFLPFVAALLIPLFHRRPALRETVTLATSALLCFTVILLHGPVLAGMRPEAPVVAIAPGLALAFATMMPRREAASRSM